MTLRVELPATLVAVNVYVVVTAGFTTIVPVAPEIAGAPLLMLIPSVAPATFHESATGVPVGTLPATFDVKLLIVGCPRPNVGPSLT